MCRMERFEGCGFNGGTDGNAGRHYRASRALPGPRDLERVWRVPWGAPAGQVRHRLIRAGAGAFVILHMLLYYKRITNVYDKVVPYVVRQNPLAVAGSSSASLIYGITR